MVKSLFQEWPPCATPCDHTPEGTFIACRLHHLARAAMPGAKHSLE